MDERDYKAMNKELNQPLQQCNGLSSLPIDKILRLDKPFSLEEILKGLVEASDILLHKKDYDGDGWEHLEYCYRHAKDVINVLQGNDV